MRHPVYLGELGSCAGLVIAAPTIYNLCLLAGFVAAQWVRMGFEEKALAAAFPEYRRYASETPRLRPVIVRRRRRASGALSSV
jgi:protein-S-isoprenylcysteine O-methyltransferase Ste14